jgi:hypothetical protein
VSDRFYEFYAAAAAAAAAATIQAIKQRRIDE